MNAHIETCMRKHARTHKHASTAEGEDSRCENQITQKDLVVLEGSTEE